MLECFQRKLFKDMEAPDHVSWDEDVVVGPDGDRDPADLALSGKIISYREFQALGICSEQLCAMQSYYLSSV
jgi:hypothetical protein